MENNNSYDWMAVKMQASDKSFPDIYSLGVSPTETTLQSKDFYKKSDKIQEMFKTKDGAFDEKAFNSYYLDAEKSLNEYKKANFDMGKGTLDLWEDTSVARALKAPIRKNPVKLSLTSRDPFTNLKAAQRSFLGLQEINKWTSPQRTLSEVAQSQKVLDGVTGKELTYTPEDTGLFNMFGFFSEPLVMAQYDNDIKDEKGKVVHKKGEFKFDEKGLPRYETLAGRNLSGKQQLSRWNTLTKEGSFSNKFDFMDSDGFDKAFTGIVVKSAVQLLPFILGGPVANAFKAYYIAQGLLEGGAEITKSLDAIFNGPQAKNGGLYRFMNSLQGYVGNSKSGVSEYGQQHFFGLESLTSLAVDSVYQLMSQEAIGRWPLEIKKYQMAKELSLAPKSIVNVGDDVTKGIFQLENYAAKYGDDWAKATIGLSKNVAALEKYGKYSKAAATAYMAATSAVGISQVSDQANLDARDKGFLYLGYMASLIPLFNSEIGGWVHKGMDMQNLSNGINIATRDYASKYLPNILKRAESTIADSTLKGRAIAVMSAGKELGKFVAGVAKNFSVTGMGTAALAEGTEEVTEQMLQNALQGIYNGLSSAGIRSTQEEAQFDLNAGDMAKDYLQNFVGGALGGAVFHKIRPEHSNVFQSDNMKEYVTEGYGAQIINKVKALQASGELGDTTLSVTPLTDEDGNVIPGMWKPVNDANPISQNDFIADRMIKEIKVNEAQRKGFNIMSPNDTAEGKNKFYQALVDTKTDTDLRDRIHDTANKIYVLANEIESINNLENETDEGMLEKKAEMKLLQKELEYLQGDESVDEYFRQGLFNIRTDINSKFGVRTRQTFTEELVGKKRKYNLLSEEDKKTVDDAYETYRQDGTDGGIKADLKRANLEYERFQKNMEGGGYKEIEAFKQSILDLDKYSQRLQLDFEGVSPLITDELKDNFQETINGLQGVQYIPDYMWDKIKRRLTSITSYDSLPYIQAMAQDLPTFKAAVENGLKSIDVVKNSPLTAGFVDKMLGSKFADLLSTEEFMDVFTNKENASNYSLLKVLKTISEAELKQDAKIAEYRQFKQSLSTLEDLDLETVLSAMNDNVELHDATTEYLKKNDFDKFVASLKEEHDMDMKEVAREVRGVRNLFSRFAKFALLSDKSGVELDSANMFGYIENPGTSNLIVDLLLEGEYHDNGEMISAMVVNQIDINQLNINVDFAKNFEQERVASPLRKLMKTTYEFLESEYENLDMVGYSNYLNLNEDFTDALDAHINAVTRLGAMINAANEINPLVNDFRKNHQSILPDTLKAVELFELSPTDSSTLEDETFMLSVRLQHLKEVNEYNKNNILAKLLKEDGLILASNAKTWQQLTGNEAVMNLLPELAEIYAQGNNIVSYAADPKMGTDEQKFEALRGMAVFEHNIYTAFQKLSEEDKKVVINSTFAPVNAISEEFTEVIDGTKELNPASRTIYLAKVFGTSSLEFANDVSGAFNEETGKFDKIENALNTPFPVQNEAIRLAYFLRNADPFVKKALFNAYGHGEMDTSGTIDFTTRANDSILTDSMVSIWGDPGTGKTTAVIAGIISTIPESIGDTVLLAPKLRQLNSLKESLVKAGHEARINTDSSLLVNDFLSSLGLKGKDGKDYNFKLNTDRFATIIGGNPKVPLPKNGSEADIIGNFNTAMNNLVSDVFKDLKLYDSKSDTQGTFKDSIVAKLAPFKLIVIDEFTHINPLDLAILTELINRYNNTTTVLNNPEKRVTIVTAGDINQMGYRQNGEARTILNYATVIASTPLTTSLRSGWDLVNNTLIDVKRRTYTVNTAKDTDLGNSDFLAEMKIPIKLTNTITPELGAIGIKVVNKTLGATTLDDIKFITDNREKLVGKSLVYVVSTHEKVTEAEALLKAALGDNWRAIADINIYSPDEVQGGEYAYAIIDAAPTFNNSIYDIKRTHEFLNTMLSRGTEATLFVNDGTVDKHVTLENLPKEAAINQKRLTPEMIQAIKDNKQALMRATLDKFVPEAVATEEGKEVPTKQPAAVTEAPAPSMKVIQISTLAKIFNDKVITDRGSAVNIPGLSATGEAKHTGGKPTDVMAYTTYSTNADFEAIQKIMFGINNAVPNDDEIELVIASYKSYLNNRGELSASNLTLNSNFLDYLEDYDYTNPTYFIEAGQRGEGGLNRGRSNISDFNQDPADIILSLKVKLASHAGSPPLILTLGILNELGSIRKKHLDLKVKDGDLSDKILKWSTDLNNFLLSDGRPPQVGITEGKTWRSFEFDQDQLNDMSDIFGSRILYKANTTISYQLVKDKYPDFVFTPPQVVVAANLDNDIGASVANKSGANTEYKKVWERLKGKSVALLTDTYPLKGKSPQELLDIYFKQLELFNTEEFLSLSPADKKRRVKELTSQGVVIKLDKLPNSTNVIPYKPNMVKLIKLDNPKAKFLEFRQYFLAELDKSRVNKHENIQEAFKQFDMPVYVKDRLVKSLMVIHKFLQMEENRKWFNDNVIAKSGKNVEDRVQKVRDFVEETFGIPGLAEDLDPDNITQRGMNSVNKFGLATMDVSQFTAELSQLLYNKDNRLIRGVYETNDNRVKDADLKTDFKEKDLDFTLSKDKQTDFSGSILSINAFQLFLKTKSLTFTELIDLSLEAFASFPLDGDKAKYSLQEVFPKGEVESVVVAANNTGNDEIDYKTNFLAEASQYSNGFTFNFGGLQAPAYNMDFDKLYKHFEAQVEDDKVDIEIEVEDKFNALLKSFKGMENTQLYKEILAQKDDMLSPQDVDNLKSTLADITLDNPMFKQSVNKPLKPSDIVAFTSSSEGVASKVTLLDYITHKMKPHLDNYEPIEDYTLTSSTENEAEFNLKTDNKEFKIEFNLANQSLTITILGAAPATAEVEPISGEPIVAPKDPMDNVRKIEKDELTKFDNFVENEFSEELKGVDAIKQYIDMYRELYRHTVVTTNIAGTEIDLAAYDPELAALDLTAWNRAKNQFVNQNEDALDAAGSSLLKMSKLIKQYKAC